MSENGHLQYEKPENGHQSFLDRINYILGGRKLSPWAQWLGFSRGTTNRIANEGQIPGPKHLSVISRAERVSLTWLIDGVGAPYIVTRCQSDDEAAALIDQHLTDEPWAVVLVTDPRGRLAVVLMQPGAIVDDETGERIEYMIIEVISGAGRKARARAVQARDVRQLELSTADFDLLSTGWMGNYKLAGWREVQGYLADTRAIDRPTINYQPEEEVFSIRLRNDEQQLIDIYRAANPAARSVILASARQLSNDVELAKDLARRLEAAAQQLGLILTQRQMIEIVEDIIAELRAQRAGEVVDLNAVIQRRIAGAR